MNNVNFDRHYDSEEIDRLIDTFIEIELTSPDNFLKIRETLTRIGVSARNTKTLFQSCHILHKRGKFYIVHFKELLALDGKDTNYNDSDLRRRNLIARLLSEWALLKIVDSSKIEEQAPINSIKIVSFGDKENWVLQPKYNLGKYHSKKTDENQDEYDVR